MTIERMHLGCPRWGFEDWVGVLYRSGTPAREFLSQYGSVFYAVEGNTTFYSLPDPATVLRWPDASTPSWPRSSTSARCRGGPPRGRDRSCG